LINLFFAKVQHFYQLNKYKLRNQQFNHSVIIFRVNQYVKERLVSVIYSQLLTLWIMIQDCLSRL